MNASARTSGSTDYPSATVSFNGEDLFLVEGTLSYTYHAMSPEGILSGIKQRLTWKQLRPDVVEAHTRLLATVEEAMTCGLSEEEYGTTFAAFIGDEVICGTFKNADQLRDRDRLRAVVSRRGSFWYAHSVLRPADRLICMPRGIHAGRHAIYDTGSRIAWRLCVGTWILLVVAAWAVLHEWGPLSPLLLMAGGFAITFLPPLVLFRMQHVSYLGQGKGADYASAIFRVYGFPRPSELDLEAGGRSWPINRFHFWGVDYERALDAHRRKFGIPDDGPQLVHPQDSAAPEKNPVSRRRKGAASKRRPGPRPAR